MASFCSSLTVHQCTNQGPERHEQQSCVEELDWPAQNPDLNLIECFGDDSETLHPAKGLFIRVEVFNRVKDGPTSD